MDPIVLIHGYSAESEGVSKKDIHGIYGSFPDDLKRLYSAAGVVEIDLSRYISLEDGISVDDISRALDRALKSDDYAHLLAGKFSVIVHSTGALVIRNWIRKFSPKPSPVKRLVYLAGANFGSGWAHIGKGQVAKWARLVFQAGAERGVQVLDALELGSSWTLDLHHHFLQEGTRMRADYGVYEFVLCGSQAQVSWFEAPVRYAREDGSDGVVRVSASNVNVQYLRFTPTKASQDIAWDELAKVEKTDVESSAGKRLKRLDALAGAYTFAETRLPGTDGPPLVPLAIPYDCAHSKETGIVIGEGPRTQVLALVQQALACNSDAAWQAARDTFDAETARTYERAVKQKKTLWYEPREQYDKHAQVIIRVRDQNGRPVEHYDVFFDSESTPVKSEIPIRQLFEDRHVNDVSPNVITFYLRTDSFDAETKTWVPRLPLVAGSWIEVSAVEPQTGEIRYLPLVYRFSAKQLALWIQPHRTTIIDVELMRVPSELVFKLAGL